jgi:hypothetical protein
MFGRGQRKPVSSGQPPSDADLRCSFCDKYKDDVRKLIAGPTVFICDECVSVCVEIISDDNRFETAKLSSEPAATADPRPAGLPPIAPAGDAVTCTLCGQDALATEVLVIEKRGVLCSACADAVEDALAQGGPPS